MRNSEADCQRLPIARRRHRGAGIIAYMDFDGTFDIDGVVVGVSFDDSATIGTLDGDLVVLGSGQVDTEIVSGNPSSAGSLLDGGWKVS